MAAHLTISDLPDLILLRLFLYRFLFRLPIFFLSNNSVLIGFTLTLHKSLVQKRYALSISGDQETIDHF
jgi:hypothetical protein